MAKQMTPAAKGLAIAVGVGLLAFAARKYGLWPTAATVAGTAAPARSRATVEIDLLYGTEKERWLKAAVEDFQRKRPDVAVKLEGMGTLEAVRAIAEGKRTPIVFSPADDIAVSLLESEWSLAKGGGIVDRDGDLAPQPLVVTPLVMIAWEDRAKVLAKAAGGDPTSWKAIHDVASNPRGWLALGGPGEWGFVKLGHTAPSSSNSGLQTLVLMAYGYHGKTAGLKPEDILDEKFQRWLKELETAAGKLGSSSGTYMRDMVLFGPSKYDAIWNYESLAISDMSAAQGRWGNLAVFYPRPTLWSNHPYVVLKGAWVTPEARQAARELRDYLLSPAAQRRALEFGFRPANPEVRVLNEDPANPFNRLKPFGIRVEIPPIAETPSGEVAKLLLETWRRVVAAGST
jgi:ABC-type Fe3+ transport system substrate-binding protein